MYYMKYVALTTLVVFCIFGQSANGQANAQRSSGVGHKQRASVHGAFPNIAQAKPSTAAAGKTIPSTIQPAKTDKLRQVRRQDSAGTLVPGSTSPAAAAKPQSTFAAIPPGVHQVERLVQSNAAKPNATDVTTGKPVTVGVRSPARPASTTAVRPAAVDRVERLFQPPPNATNVKTGKPDTIVVPVPGATHASAVERRSSGILATAKRSGDRVASQLAERVAADNLLFRLWLVQVDQALRRGFRRAHDFYDDGFHSWGIRPPTLREWLEVGSILAVMRPLSRGDVQAALQTGADSHLAQPLEHGILRFLERAGDKIGEVKDNYLYGPQAVRPNSRR